MESADSEAEGDTDVGGTTRPPASTFMFRRQETMTLNYVWTHIRSRAVLLLLALVGTALVAGACGGGQEAAAPTPAQKATIKIADNQWEALYIENAIFKFIVENGYEYPVEEVIVSTPIGQISIASGDLDVWVDLYEANLLDWYRKEIAAGNIIHFKNPPLYEGQPQFFIVPKWVSEQYNIKAIEDMKRPEVVKLFPDPEDPTKGAFINCIIGWQCAEINRAKLQAYGLDKYYNIISPGSGAAEKAAIVGAMKNNKPVFAYWWSPDSLMGAYDWYVLEEPPYSEECWTEVQKGRDDLKYTPKQACAYESGPVGKLIHKGMQQKAPDVVAMLEKMSIGLEALNKTAVWAQDNDIQGDWNKAAVYFLKTFEDRWTAWMPADKTEKVRAALAKVSS